MNTISFMTANYVARQVGYDMTEGWGQGDKATNEYFQPVETFGERFEEYLSDVKAMGFEAFDLWTSILNPPWMTDAHVSAAQDVIRRLNLRVSTLGGWFASTPEQWEKACQLAVAMGTTILGGDTSVAQKNRPFLIETLRKHGLKWAFENHPNEKTPQDVLSKIGTEDSDVVGVCVDTGWFGTNGQDAPKALEELAPRLLHVHLKDVRHVGTHETCRYGEGVVDIKGCVDALKRIGYSGAISVEHEPDFFDPSDDVKASFEMLKGWLAQ